MSANLPGSGTKEDPYLISSYEDFKKMDSSSEAIENPKEYKLINSLNMTGRKWSGINLCNGRLNLSDHMIFAPDIGKNSFLFSDGVIYADSETYDAEGNIDTPAKSGYILNIVGDSPSTICKNVDFERIGVTIPNLPTINTPFQSITTKMCNFYIDAKLNTYNPFFRGKQLRLDPDNDSWIGNSAPSFVDTRFVINGILNPNNYSDNTHYAELFVVNGYEDVVGGYTNEVVLERCLIEGSLNAANIRKIGKTDKIPFYVTRHGLNSCFIALQGPSYSASSGKTQRVGYLGPSKSIAPKSGNTGDVGLNINLFTDSTSMTNVGSELTLANMLIPSKVIATGFNVIEISPGKG